MSEKEKDAITLFNKGRRHFDVMVEGKTRRHSPGQTLSYSLDDAKVLDGYKDLVDISKMAGQPDTRKLKAENDTLATENQALKDKIALLEGKPEDKKPEEKKDAPKGKTK